MYNIEAVHLFYESEMVPLKSMAFLLYFNRILYISYAATYYFTTERPVVQFVNPKYVAYFNITSLRYGRRNPMYYVNMHATLVVPADNNLTFDIYFYEKIYNQYRLSLLEFHFKWCNLFLHDAFFASGLRKNLPSKCPHPPGSYHMYNMTLNADAIPEAFPFTKGRMLVNASYRSDPAGSVYIDLELKKYKKLKL